MAEKKTSTKKKPAGPSKTQKEAISSGNAPDQKTADWAVSKGFARSYVHNPISDTYTLNLTGKKT